jgi:hypothetical protein
MKLIDKICDNFSEEMIKLNENSNKKNMKLYLLFEEYLKIHDFMLKEFN